MTDEPYLLLLPYHIRRQIYSELGIISDRNRWTNLCNWTAQWSSREQRLKGSRGFPNQLFYVCRVISEDVRSLVYSENLLWFLDGYSDGLQNLVNLTPRGWKSLRSIVVTIGTQPCGFPCPLVCDARHACHGGMPRIIEDDRKLEASGVLTTWRLICSKLAMYSQEDDRLELRLICGAASKETAGQFLDPIQDLPRLKQLSIRMGPYRNLELQQMIMTTIGQKTTYFSPSPERPFPFLKLPVEVQMRILEHSGLIAPDALSSGLYYTSFTPTDCREFNCPAHPTPEALVYCEDRYCSSTHTAFSTLYPCSPITYGLFSASRGIRHLAQSVYYPKNIFDVYYYHEPSGSRVPVEESWSPCTSTFLCHFPRHSWAFLRHVRWIFLNMDGDAFHYDKTEVIDWMNTLKTLSLAIQPSALTLELCFPAPRWMHRPPIDPEQIKSQWASYNRIVDVCIPWKHHLRDIFVYNYCPVFGETLENRLYSETLLEQKVMGPGYDSLSRGKDVHKREPWND